MVPTLKNVTLLWPNSENLRDNLESVIEKISMTKSVVVIDSLNGFFNTLEDDDAGMLINSFIMMLASSAKNTKSIILVGSLSKLNDEMLWNLIESPPITDDYVQIQFFDDNKINKIKVYPDKYNAIFFRLDNFVLNSINEIVAKKGFFEIDYKSTFYYERTDLKKEGGHLAEDTCSTGQLMYDKQIYNPGNDIEIVQIEKDKEHLILGGQGNLWTEYISTNEKAEYMEIGRAHV